ncbi:MAG TPA: hypothetical protein VLV78_03045 [Thermoanaerobaculia bacterium]|nr:hypothetical protein [Thermoanaerobaculia bacterium]
MTTAAASADYFLEIESHFAARRGTPFILSAKDWALMKKWFDDGVPLAVVVEAIDSVFDKNETSGRRKVISSLSYCRHAVKEVWQDRQDLYAGSGEGTPEENVAELLEALAAEVEPSSTQTAAEIRALITEKSVPRIEERLIAIEHDLMERILASLSPDERRDIEQPLAAIVADESLDDKTRQRTWEANVRRRIRDKFGLPRLTLFR